MSSSCLVLGHVPAHCVAAASVYIRRTAAGAWEYVQGPMRIGPMAGGPPEGAPAYKLTSVADGGRPMFAVIFARVPALPERSN